MEHVKFTCDIKNREQHSELVSRKKLPVMFDHDQDDGKSRLTPYFEMNDIDICENCFKEMTEKRILIYAYGAMEYKNYSFPSFERIISEEYFFTCKYYSGSGRQYDGGIWQKKETPKTITFTLEKEPFFCPNYNLLTFKKDTKTLTDNEIRYSGYGHVLTDRQDGFYTIYPDQSGTPYVFEPVKLSTDTNLEEKYKYEKYRETK